jgi:hypothetical protein
VIVRLVVSHLVDPDTFGSVLVNTTSHETSFVASTVTVELVVDRLAGEAALLRVNVSAGLSTVPVQVSPSWSVNESVPFSGAPCADVIVALSFGSQT